MEVDKKDEETTAKEKRRNRTKNYDIMQTSKPIKLNGKRIDLTARAFKYAKYKSNNRKYEYISFFAQSVHLSVTQLFL